MGSHLRVVQLLQTLPLSIFRPNTFSRASNRRRVIAAFTLELMSVFASFLYHTSFLLIFSGNASKAIPSNHSESQITTFLGFSKVINFNSSFEQEVRPSRRLSSSITPLSWSAGTKPVSKIHLFFFFAFYLLSCWWRFCGIKMHRQLGLVELSMFNLKIQGI